MTCLVLPSSLLSSITGPTQPQGEEEGGGGGGGGEGVGAPVICEPCPPGPPPPLAPCEEGCDQERTEHGGIKRVCFKVEEEDQEDSGHDTMSYRDSYR